MSSFPSRAIAGLCSAGLLLLPAMASAAPCGRPDVDATFPPNGASQVPNNAVLSAHYAAPALYDDEPVEVTDGAGNAVPVTVTYDEADSLLRAAPEQPLSEGTLHVNWPELRGLGSGGIGRGSQTTFSVQAGADAAAPTFAGLTGIDWDLSRDRDPCLDRLEDRFVFQLQLGAATEDTGTPSLALLVFQTQDPEAPARTEPSRVALRPFPENGQVEVRRPANKAGRACFAAVVQDLVGQVSGGGEREVCVNTKLPPFFDGCSVRAVNGGADNAWLWPLLFALFVGGRRARARAA